jgi:transcriptional regulator with XRE-family HTH domain
MGKPDISKIFKSNLEKLQADRSLSQFAKDINIHIPTLANYLKGRIPKGEKLVELSEKLKVSIDWLLTGKGSMKLSDDLIEKSETYRSAVNAVILTPDELKKRLKESEPQESYIPIPLLPDSVIIKDAINIDDKDIEGFTLIYKDWLQQDHIYRCIRIKDNSMSPIFEEDFIAAIDCTNNDPSMLEGKIVTARYQDNLSIRKLLLTNEYYILQPQNTLKFQPIKIPIAEKSIIIGKVACWFGKS